MSEIKFKAVGLLGTALIRSVHGLSRVTTDGEEHWRALRAQGRPWVLCAWHGSMLSPIWQHQQEGLIALVSDHRDGEYITRVIKRLGFGTARGSSTRGGVKGLRGLLRAARSGRDLAITPDGPRGPREQMKVGALVAAQRGGLPIICVGVGMSRAWRASSWDRFSIPKPFSRVHLTYGAPIEVASDLDANGLERAAAEVQARMDEVTHAARTAVADALLGEDGS